MRIWSKQNRVSRHCCKGGGRGGGGGKGRGGGGGGGTPADEAAQKLGITNQSEPSIELLGAVASHMSTGASARRAVQLVNKGKTSNRDIPDVREGMSQREFIEGGFNAKAIREKAQARGIGRRGEPARDLLVRMQVYNNYTSASPQEKRDYVNNIRIFPPGKLPKQYTVNDLIRGKY